MNCLDGALAALTALKQVLPNGHSGAPWSLDCPKCSFWVWSAGTQTGRCCRAKDALFYRLGPGAYGGRRCYCVKRNRPCARSTRP